MTTLTWLTGFEYGLGNMSANGGGLCDAVLNTCKVSLVGGAFPPAHSVGQYILQCAPSNSVKAFITKNIPGTPNIIVHRFYINFGDTLPVGDIVVYSLTTTGHKVQVSWKSADAKFYIGIDGALTPAHGPGTTVTYPTSRAAPPPRCRSEGGSPWSWPRCAVS